jgi:hypothetical protein
MVEKNSSFPVIPIRDWWALRKKFRQSVPTSLPVSYLMISLNIKEEKTARVNVYDQLIKIGLIDKDGKVNQELANKWREDEHYAEVCKQIRQKIYPRELLDLDPNLDGNRVKTARWFRINAGVGESRANKMAAVYELLTEANPNKGEETGSSKTAKRNGTDNRSPKDQKPSNKTKEQFLGNETEELPETHSWREPSIHIDIQIHLSPDAPAEQIEQVFANMAKYLYPKHK